MYGILSILLLGKSICNFEVLNKTLNKNKVSLLQNNHLHVKHNMKVLNDDYNNLKLIIKTDTNTQPE